MTEKLFKMNTKSTYQELAKVLVVIRCWCWRKVDGTPLHGGGYC